MVPPSPLVSWNHRVRRKFSVRSLNLKGLRVRSLIANDLASISHLVVKPACPIDNLGPENGLFFSEPSVVIKDRPNPASPPEKGISEAKSLPKRVSGGFDGRLGRRTHLDPLLIRAYCRARRVVCLLLRVTDDC